MMRRPEGESVEPCRTATIGRGSRKVERAMPELQIGDTITLTIEHYDPSRDSTPRLKTYAIPYTKEMRVLEALDHVVEELGESLAYQWFCGVKKCGMCGVMINGRQALACWEPVEPEMTIRPLAGFPVVRDLVIDRSRYFANVHAIRPWIQRQRPYGGFPEAITGTELTAAAETMHCIECMLCVSACPADGDLFMGPAPMVQLARYALDPRDEADRATTALVAGGIDDCVGCRQCSRVCPTGIRVFEGAIEGLKRQIRHAGLAGPGSMRSKFFANVHGIAKLACRFAPLVNWAGKRGVVRRALEAVLRIDRRRELPTFAAVPFDRWFAGRSRPPDRDAPSVVLFHDTFVTYFEPEIGQAATRVLEAAGYGVSLADGRKCCGRPMLSEGAEDEARAVAEHNVRLLAPIVRRGTPIVGLEPSCVSAIRGSYRELVGGDDARLVAEAILTFEEFVAAESQAGRFKFSAFNGSEDILLHGHCHQKTMSGTGPSIETLALTGAGRIEEIPTTCCGMAGSNGYEFEHYERSLEAAEVALFPAVRAASPTVEIVAAGISCRQQIRSGTGRLARHPAQVLFDALAGDAAPEQRP